MSNFIIYLFAITATVVLVSSKSFGFGDDVDFFNRPASVLGNAMLQDWRSGFQKRFGEISHVFGTRPQKWEDWKQLFKKDQRRSLGNNGEENSFETQSRGNKLWNPHKIQYMKKSE
ncbi:hypothetical protein ACF0H5_017992 [Mactra antiquata]